MMKINKKGFTLVEVLIAMFILTVGIMAVIGMLTVALRSGSFGRATTVANRLVQQQLEEVKSITFSTAANSMCGYGVSKAPGFTDYNCTKTSSLVFTNRTSTKYTVNYKIPGGGQSNLTNVIYEVTLQNVKNYPMTDVDMIAIKAKWKDVNGYHETTAMTYMER